MIKKDHGLIVHTHDCSVIFSNRKSTENFLDVAWGKDIARTFEVSMKVETLNEQGVLARVSAEIAKAE